MIWVFNIFLMVLCIGQFMYIRNIKKVQNTWLDALRSAHRGEDQKIFAWGSGLIADISFELNGIIKSYKAQISSLREAGEANRQILTGLSHDVRTPLASLLGYLEALKKGGLSACDESGYIEVAYQKANDLKIFIDMLFEWFKLGSNEQQFHFEEIEINEFTREILAEWAPICENLQILISANISGGSLFVLVDKQAYKRVLGNLIQNAIHHGNCKNINTSIKNTCEGAEIIVSNDGEAIPAQELPYIFDRLYKGGTARPDKGSGLGLAIVKGLVSSMHGEISVASPGKGGTAFTIVLPIPGIYQKVRKK
jgi:signal transduction histidine kinase